MFEILGLIATAGASAGGYIQSRKFVRDRLTYVDAVRRPSAPWIAGIGAAAIASPVVAILPLVGTATAMLFGAGVGLGTAAGARQLSRRLGAG